MTLWMNIVLNLGKLLIPSIFALLIPHFLNIVFVEHVIFHVFTLTFLVQEKGHGHQKKPHSSQTNIFLGRTSLFFFKGKTINNRGKREQGYEYDDMFQLDFHWE